MTATHSPILTRALIRAAHPDPVVDDPTVMKLASEEELIASRDAFLASRPDPKEDLWVFGYGSLMWKPEPDFAESVRAIALGWHRRYCLWQWRHRGTKTNPGLMLALDRGGSCVGLAFRIPGPDVALRMMGVWRREMLGAGYVARWLRLKTDQGEVQALGFVVNKMGPRYAGKLSLTAIAEHIAAASGSSGPSAEYLLETHECCVRLGIGDRMLANVQAMVAARLQARLQGKSNQ